jgi:uncharacterized protein with NAD-binding domain and iron-sulfur cluster
MGAAADQTTSGGGRAKVAIVGGGAGGAAAAFWLSSTPALRSRYDVTLYTRGWRLGGKGASGRNAACGQRIEEHGLHLWLGFYENAFTMMRQVYAAWVAPPDSPIKTFDEAFSPLRKVVMEQSLGTAWSAWEFDFPQLPGQPGDPDTNTVETLVAKASAAIRVYLNRLEASHGLLGSYAAIAEAFETTLGDVADDTSRDIALAAIHSLQRCLTGARHLLETPETTDELGQFTQRVLILVNLGLALMTGYILDILPVDPEHNHQAGYDQLDDQEFRAWLRAHGAWDETIDAPPIRCLYDLTFAFLKGDASSPDNGALACGVTLKLLESLVFRYKDAPLWKMNAGMGDIVFAPLYRVLTARGVTINFFHALTDVALSDDGRRIVSLTFNRQAALATPPYCPLVAVNGLPCWPSEPDWAQLRDGAALKAARVNFESIWDTTTDATVSVPVSDGDCVVLAVPPEMLKYAAPKLTAKPRWAEMLDNSASVATLATQLWVSAPNDKFGALDPNAPLTCFAEPLDTWCDMSHLLPRENWDAADAPKAIAYFCGALNVPLLGPQDPDPGAALLAQVTAATGAWLDANIAAIWPKISAPGGGLRDGIVTSSYYRANYDPSELYVQIPQGSVKHRLTPGSCVFSNLYLAGDWTRTPVSGGCVETAVQSGLLAAEAITGLALLSSNTGAD